MFKLTPGQFEHIVSQTPQGVLGQFLTALLVSLLLLKIGFPATNLYIWDICGAALLVHRYMIFKRFYRNQDFSGNPPNRQMVRSYVISVFLMGVLWAVLFAKIIQQPMLELHYLAMVIGIGLASTAIVTMGAAPRVYFAFVSPMLFSLVASFLLQASYAHITAALFLLVGTLFSFYAAHKYALHFQRMLEITEQLRETEIEALVCLGKAGEYRDSDTGDHVLRVGYASYLLAKAAGFTEQDAKTLMYASPLHDLGKIGIPDRILLKPGKLTDEEFHAMKRHTSIGAEILKNSKSSVMKMAKKVALSHHEKWDGSGYPNGISGKKIPIEGRIVAICDVYDALIFSRPYKKCWTDAEAIDYLRKNAGTHFDPGLVELFIRETQKIRVFSSRLEDHESATGLHPLIQLA